MGFGTGVSFALVVAVTATNNNDRTKSNSFLIVVVCGGGALGVLSFSLGGGLIRTLLWFYLNFICFR